MRAIVILGLIGFFALTITFMASHLSVGSMPSSKYISTPLYKPGDIVYIKPDSARVSIVSVFKSGMIDPFNHYKVNMGGGNKQVIGEFEIYGK
jgi:hypothetical protein